MKKAFVLTFFDGEGTGVLAVIEAKSLSEAQEFLGSDSTKSSYADGNAITRPTRGLTPELIEECQLHLQGFDTLYLDEAPVFG